MSHIEAVEKKKQVFLQWFNSPKYLVVGLLMMEGQFTLIFTMGMSLINTVDWKFKQMFLERVCYYVELSCFRNIVLPYYLRMILHVFIIR